ncbi:MAG TPA: PKD domain-containing protein [Chryseosolibacter sp.]|nr:PKD domain-containing protein [Chryseosolibacter sp.]
MKITLFVLLFFLYASSFAQLQVRVKECTDCPDLPGNMSVPSGGYYDYADDFTVLSNSHVASDFGSRRSNSRWHIGIDMARIGGDQSMGDAIFPIETGTVIKVIGGDGNYKVIVIRGAHRFGYGHIFFSGSPGAAGMRSGNFILMKMKAPQHSYYCIIYAPPGQNPVAFGPVNGYVNHPLLNNGADITVTNQITNINIPVAPMGDSGSTDVNDFSAHVHLYSFQNDPANNDVDSGYPRGYNATFFRNAKNALEFIDYDAPSYLITFPSRQNGNPQIAYPGTNNSFFQVRASMYNAGQFGPAGDVKYSNVTMDVEKVELLLKGENQPAPEFKLIKGRTLESKIQYGGRLNTDRYPSVNFPPHNTGTMAIDIGKGVSGGIDHGTGSITRTGIDPYAYNTQPYDDYYFSDFYPRIHKDDNYSGVNARFASISDEARYPDGIYDYFVRLTTVTNQFHNSTFEKLTIDNFRPFIKEIVIRKDNATGAMIYRGYWQWNGAQLSLFKENYNDATPTDYVWIKVTTSEPMGYTGVLMPVGINIPSVDGVNVFRQMSAIADTDNREFEITYSPIGSSGVKNIKLIGVDVAGNALERMQTSPITLPIRTAANAWTPAPNAGDDENHYFNAGPATCGEPGGRTTTSGGCLIANFNADIRQTSPGSPVVVTSLASGSGTIQYLWNFGAGASPATATTAGPHSVTYTSAGDKTVTLTVTDNSGTATATKTNYINVANSHGAADFTASATSGPGPLVTNFSAIYSGTATSWAWNFPGGNPATSTSQNPVVTYSNSGTYNVTVVINGSTTVTKASYINVTAPPPMTVSINHCDNYNFSGCDQSYDQYQGIYFKANVTGGTPYYDYMWTFGDGGTSQSMEPLYSFNRAGTYNVSVAVTDLGGTVTTSSINIVIATVIPTITANWTTSDSHIVATDGPVVFTDASTANIDLELCQYYWDFGDGAYPRYAYSRGPHTVCYDDFVPNKTVYLSVEDPINRKGSIKRAENHIFVDASNMAHCGISQPQWKKDPGVRSDGIIEHCAWPNETVGVKDGTLANLLCTDGTWTECAFDPVDPCFKDTWFASHGDISLRNNNNTSVFRLWAAGDYDHMEDKVHKSSEGLVYQHTTTFKPGYNYRFSFYAAKSSEEARPVQNVDHLRFALTKGLQPYTGCDDGDNAYQPPSYAYSIFELGSFDNAIRSTTMKCFEVIFYAPQNSNFDQIWIRPEVEQAFLGNFEFSPPRHTWVLLDNFSLRTEGVSDCAADIMVYNTTPIQEIFQAGVSVKTSGAVTVANGITSTFRAGNQIMLKPGFRASQGSTFSALIGECTLNAGREDANSAGDVDSYLVNKRGINSGKDFIKEPKGPPIYLAEARIELFPNPARKQITLSLTGFPDDNYALKVINVLGVEVHTEIFKKSANSQLVIDVDKFGSGLYYIQIMSRKGIHTKEFIVQ